MEVRKDKIASCKGELVCASAMLLLYRIASLNGVFCCGRWASDRGSIFANVTEADWDKFIQHNMTLYRCLILDIHDSSYALFSTNMISNTGLHVGRPLLRPFLVAYAEATLARQKKIAQQTKSVDIISVYLLRTNGQLFEMNVKIVRSYLQAGKSFDPLQHD